LDCLIRNCLQDINPWRKSAFNNLKNDLKLLTIYCYKKPGESKGLKHYSWINQPYIRAKIIGAIILIATVTFFLFRPITPINMKIGFAFVFIAIFIVFLVSEKSILKSIGTLPMGTKLGAIKKMRLPMSEKIALTLIMWILLMFFITRESDLETFFILILIGMLIVKEFSYEYISTRFINRLNIFIFIFVIVFIAIEVKKIISF